MNELAKRKTLLDLIETKAKLVQEMKNLHKQDQLLESAFKEVDGYRPYRIEYNERYQTDEQIIDKAMWRYLVKYFHLKDFMLSTDYEKLENQVEHNQTPSFNLDNAGAWIADMKNMINRGVQGLAESVYNRIINAPYWTSGNIKKKRNNMGLDSFFILTTGDYKEQWYTYHERLTITDDLEKLCYLLDGENLPEPGLKNLALRTKVMEIECPYFKIKMCKNGNTHYFLTDETVARLNKIGANSNIIGTDIKIKVF